MNRLHRLLVCGGVAAEVRRACSQWAKQSYVHGASSVPLVNATVGQLLHAAAERHPDRDLFVFPHQHVRRSYAAFLAEARQFASGLLSIGLRRGDRLGIWSPNLYEWVVTQFGAALAGIILVNINPAYQLGELEYCVQKVGMKAIVAAPNFKSQDYYRMLTEICTTLHESAAGQLHDTRMPELRHVIMIGDEQRPGAWRFSDIPSAADSASDAQVDELLTKVQPDEPTNIQFTSGTTGAPKGATLSHHNIVNNAYFVGRRVGYHEQPHVICCPPPLYHCLGCVVAALAGVVGDAAVVFPSRSFEALPSLRAIDEEKCTSVYGTPTMFIDMLNHADFDTFDYSSLKTGIMAGAPCPVEVCKQLMERMHMREFTIAYGTTENSPVTFQSLRTDAAAARVASVGHVHDHVEAKVVDADNGATVARGRRGELLIRGYCVMLNYWDDRDKTAQVISEDRWYHTGDLAVMDENGLVAIVGRLKDVIIRGGENIYPTEIEQFLYTHPKIEDVQVIGVPDERLGEEVCAWIRLHPQDTATEDEIKQFCKGKIAHFKVPRYIQFKKEAEFPVTVTGKVQKFRMREISKRELGLTAVVAVAVVKGTWKTDYAYNDVFTSISSGICSQIVFKAGGQALVVSAYTYIFDNWRLVDLHATSASTWLLCAFAADFAYYLAHRASHEVSLLWALHQMHHSSQYFNLATALRQPAYQNVVLSAFDLSLALLIPAPIFVVHKYLNILYQFWIHSAVVGKLGPLEWVLNTPSHHRVHHGSNPYCIDKNYAGVLIVWDRLFGTFECERDGEAIHFGLVSNVNSFDQLYLQHFQFKHVLCDKMKGLSKVVDVWRAIWFPPGWSPGERLQWFFCWFRLENTEKGIPPADGKAVKYDPPLPAILQGYVVAVSTMFVVSYGLQHAEQQAASNATYLTTALFVVWAMQSIGYCNERRYALAVKTEITRWLSLVILSAVTSIKLVSIPQLALTLLTWLSVTAFILLYRCVV